MQDAVDLGGELTVDRLGFGAMRITGDGLWGEPERPDEARAVLRRAVELGVDVVDTAHSYGPEVSERLTGETLRPYADVVVATKSGFKRSGPNAWQADCRPATIRADCERSLQLLGVERIDLFQLHTVDPAVPYEESVGALVDLQREGKLRCIGVSNVDVDHLRRAQALADVVSAQNRYSILGPRVGAGARGVRGRRGRVRPVGADRRLVAGSRPAAGSRRAARCDGDAARAGVAAAALADDAADPRGRRRSRTSRRTWTRADWSCPKRTWPRSRGSRGGGREEERHPVPRAAAAAAATVAVAGRRRGSVAGRRAGRRSCRPTHPKGGAEPPYRHASEEIETCL